MLLMTIDTRLPQTGEWVLALEGICRAAISRPAVPKNQMHTEVAVRPLLTR